MDKENDKILYGLVGEVRQFFKNFDDYVKRNDCRVEVVEKRVSDIELKPIKKIDNTTGIIIGSVITLVMTYMFNVITK